MKQKQKVLPFISPRSLYIIHSINVFCSLGEFSVLIQTGYCVTSDFNETEERRLSGITAEQSAYEWQNKAQNDTEV